MNDKCFGNKKWKKERKNKKCDILGIILEHEKRLKYFILRVLS